MVARHLSREEELVAFFVGRCDGRLGKTKLMKLIYLADYEARRYLGRPLSNAKYVWYFYGPWDPQLETWIAKLTEANVIVEEAVVYPTGAKGYLYSRGAVDVPGTFTAAENELLSYVCKRYSERPLRELLDEIVYETEPMREAREAKAKNAPLKMDSVNGAKAKELVIPFEELLERSRELHAGQGLSHAEAMAEVEKQLAPDVVTA